MKSTNGKLKSKDADGNEVEEMLFTYSEEEKQENEINSENAKKVFAPKFIPFYPWLASAGLTMTECLIVGFVDFYCSSGTSGKFYFTNDQLAEVIQCSPDTISRAVSKIEKKGIINVSRKVRSGGGQVRFIRLGKTYKLDSSFPTSWTRQNLQTNKNKINKNKIKGMEACASSTEIVDIISLFKEINPEINYGNKTNRKSASNLIKRYGFDEVKRGISAAISIQGEKYAPVVTTPYHFQQKMAQLKIYFEKEKSNKITFV